MAVKCGKCHEKHPDVATVRLCHQGKLSTKGASVKSDIAPSQNGVGATDKQITFVNNLLTERVIPTGFEVPIIDGISGADVRKLIDALLGFDKKPNDVKLTDQFPDIIHQGRYALEVDGELRFYQIDVPPTGKWVGRMFVKQLFGSPGDFRMEPIRNGAALTILQRINAKPKAAMRRFGKEVGECGKCHSPLTNEDSRRLGVGPICRQTMGW